MLAVVEKLTEVHAEAPCVHLTTERDERIEWTRTVAYLITLSIYYFFFIYFFFCYRTLALESLLFVTLGAGASAFEAAKSCRKSDFSHSIRLSG